MRAGRYRRDLHAMRVTEEIALQLGFDITEVSQQVVTLTDEPLMGVLPLEAMDLLVDPLKQRVLVNPKHPNFSVGLAK